MADFQIVEAKSWYCGMMARALRLEHQKALIAIGAHSHRELHNCFDMSAYRRAWLVNGKLAGLGGVTGNTISTIGHVWVTLTENATGYPFAIVKESRRQLALLMGFKRTLITTILPGDETSRRFAIYLGFVAAAGGGEAAFSRSGRRDLADKLVYNTDSAVKIGNGQGLMMKYQIREAA